MTTTPTKYRFMLIPQRGDAVSSALPYDDPGEALAIGRLFAERLVGNSTFRSKAIRVDYARLLVIGQEWVEVAVIDERTKESVNIIRVERRAKEVSQHASH